MWTDGSSTKFITLILVFFFKFQKEISAFRKWSWSEWYIERCEKYHSSIHFNLDSNRIIAISICHLTNFFQKLSICIQIQFNIAKCNGDSVQFREILSSRKWFFIPFSQLTLKKVHCHFKTWRRYQSKRKFGKILYFRVQYTETVNE